MDNFELLKRTYPVSEFERLCDGYNYIKKHTTQEERKSFGKLQKIIKIGEKYIYQVAKEGKEFKTMCISFKNYAIIRKEIFKLDDE
jgi:hypothetical protein